jgi:thioredoxin 1
VKHLFLACNVFILSIMHAQVIHIVSGADFQRYLNDAKMPLVVKFYMKGCPPCARLKPILDQLSHEFAGKVIFIEADVKELPHLANQFGIRTVPTVLYFKNGTQHNKRIGVSDYLIYQQDIAHLL